MSTYSDTRRERCEIKVLQCSDRRPKGIWFADGEVMACWIADAIGPQGRYIADQSRQFAMTIRRDNDWFKEPGKRTEFTLTQYKKYPISYNEEEVKALWHELVARLSRGGWDPDGIQGKQWYNKQFTRVLRGPVIELGLARE